MATVVHARFGDGWTPSLRAGDTPVRSRRPSSAAATGEGRYDVDGLVARLVHLMVALEDHRITDHERRLIRRHLVIAMAALGPD